GRVLHLGADESSRFGQPEMVRHLVVRETHSLIAAAIDSRLVPAAVSCVLVCADGDRSEKREGETKSTIHASASSECVVLRAGRPALRKSEPREATRAPRPESAQGANPNR